MAEHFNCTFNNAKQNHLHILPNTLLLIHPRRWFALDSQLLQTLDCLLYDCFSIPGEYSPACLPHTPLSRKFNFFTIATAMAATDYHIHFLVCKNPTQKSSTPEGSHCSCVWSHSQNSSQASWDCCPSCKYEGHSNLVRNPESILWKLSQVA